MPLLVAGVCDVRHLNKKMCNVEPTSYRTCIQYVCVSNYVLLLPEFPLAAHSYAKFDFDLADAVVPSIVDNTFFDVVVVLE